MGLGFRERFGIRILGRFEMVWAGRVFVCFGVRSRVHVYSEVPLAFLFRWREWRLAMCPIDFESGFWPSQCANKFRQGTMEASCSDVVCHAKRQDVLGRSCSGFYARQLLAAFVPKRQRGCEDEVNSRPIGAQRHP
jgi:hypothetical protein